MNQEQTHEIQVTMTTETIHNMTIEHWHVSKESIGLIKQVISLDSEYLLEQINLMMDRTPNYEDLSEEEQQKKVGVILDCEAALAYLEQSELIKPNCIMADFQYDYEHEDVLVDVFYVSEDVAINQALNQFNLTKEEAEKLETAVNIFNQDESIVEQAKKKFAKIKRSKERNHIVENARKRVQEAQAVAARKQAQKIQRENQKSQNKVVPFKRRSN